MPASPSGRTVGFVGLGNLGRPMALNLVERGWEVQVLDADPSRTESVVSAGAVGATAEELPGCDILAFVVPDDTAIRAILLGDDGILDRLGSQHTVIVHSTILPGAARELGELVTGRGARFLDAPVSGGADRARGGDLTVMVGGSDDDVAAGRPILEDLASNLVHVGPVGAGSATKLANQLITFSALGGLYEAMRLAGEYGVSESAVLEAVATATGDTWVGRTWGFYDRLSADYDQNGTPAEQRPWVKDLREVTEVAAQTRLDLPIAQLLATTLADYVTTHARATDGGPAR